MDAGASALDAVFGSVPVSVSGSVDTSKVGQYVITYSAVDASGNHAIEVTRTITVVDTTAPIITLNGGDLQLKLDQSTRMLEHLLLMQSLVAFQYQSLVQ